jgi:hypothetical protein
MSTAILPPLPSPSQAWSNRLLALLLPLFLLAALSCLAGGAQPNPGQGQNLERSVKAAFLYKFLGYVDFPGEAPAQYTVAVMEADDVAAELAQIAKGRTVNNRPIEVKSLHEGDALNGVQLLFIGGDTSRPQQVLRAAAQQGVLTVTEVENGLQQGSVINFRVVEDRVRFEVSLPAAEKNNVKLSSRLLSVAYQVQKGGQ